MSTHAIACKLYLGCCGNSEYRMHKAKVDQEHIEVVTSGIVSVCMKRGYDVVRDCTKSLTK